MNGGIELKVQISSVDQGEGKRLMVMLAGPSDMHPEGGGQPGDSGELHWDGGRAKVLNTLKGGLLDVLPEKGSLVQGMEVCLDRDESRNALLSRMHSAEHVLSRVMENLKPGLSVYKVAVGEERTGVYLRYDGDIDWDFAFQAERETRSIVDSAMPVETLEVSVEQARSMDGLKARWDRVDDAVIRVVRIPGFDLIACSGSHVSNTSQIGDICVESIKGSAPEWEISFSLGEGFYVYSQEMRRLVSRLNCSPQEIGKIIDRLTEENHSYKRYLTKIAPYVELPWQESTLYGTRISYCAPVGLPSDLLSQCGRKRAVDVGGIVLAISDDGISPRIPFMLWDCDEILKVKELLSSPDLDARGGGRGGSISGQTGCRSADKWLNALELVLQK